jgi:hypothetical protein
LSEGPPLSIFDLPPYGPLTGNEEIEVQGPNNEQSGKTTASSIAALATTNALQKGNNLDDVQSVVAARSNLGVTPGFKPDPATGAFVIVATGQSNEGGFGESNGVTTAGGDLYINQTGGGILIWNGTTFVTAVYGTAPLTNQCPAPNNSLASNNAVAFANSIRASGLIPANTPIWIIWEWASGTSISNQIGLKTVNGSLVGQFLLNLCYAPIVSAGISQVGVVLVSQGQRDSEGSVGDTYTTGPFSSSQCFGNSIPPTAGAGALVPGANPVYPSLFSLPSSVATAVDNAGGFNTYAGFQAALNWYVGGLLRAIPAIGATTPILWFEIQGTANAGTGEYARTDALTYAAAYGPGKADPYFAVVPAADLPTSAVGGNGAHFTSASQNIMGARAVAAWAAMAFGSAFPLPVKDQYGNAVAARAALFITNNSDAAGGPSYPTICSAVVTSLTASGTTATCTTSSAHGLITGQSINMSQSTVAAFNVQGAVITVTGATTFTYTMGSAPGQNSPNGGTYVLLGYYYVSVMQARNGVNLRLSNSNVIIPNAQTPIGGTDVHIYVYTVAGGNSSVLALQPILGLGKGVQVQVGTELLWQYTFAAASPGPVILDSINGSWIVSVSGQPQAVGRGGRIGLNAARINLSGPVLAGQTVTVAATVNGTPIAGVSQAFITSSDQTLANVAAAVLVQINGIAAGFTSEDIPTQNIIQFDAGYGTAAASAALVFTSCTVTGTGSLPTASFDAGIRSLSPADTSNQALDVNAGTIVVFPPSNGASGAGGGGRTWLLATGAGGTAGPILYDFNSADTFYDQGGKAHIGGNGTTPFYLGTNLGIVLEPCETSRWAILGGTFDPEPGMGQNSTLFYPAATISSLTNVGTLCTMQTSAAHNLSTGQYITVSGASPSAYNGTFQVTVTGAETLTYQAATNPGSSASPVGSYLPTLITPQCIGVAYRVSAGTTLVIPAANSANMRVGFISYSGGSFTLQPASQSIRDQYGNGQTSLTVPGGRMVVLESAENAYWSITGGSILGRYSTGQLANNPGASITAQSGQNDLFLSIRNTSSPIAALSIALPQGPNDGDTITIFSQGPTINQLSLSGGSVSGFTNGTPLVVGSVLVGTYTAEGGDLWCFGPTPIPVVSNSHTANFTVPENETISYIDCTAGSILALLPSTPYPNERHWFCDDTGQCSGSNTFSISGNGHTVNGLSSNVPFIETAYGTGGVIWAGSGWVITS